MAVLRIFSFLKPYVINIILVLSLLVFVTLISIAPPWLMRYAIDNFIMQKNFSMLLVILAIIISIGILEGIIRFLQRYSVQYIGHKIVLDIRNLLFSHVNDLSFSFHNKTRTGELIARITSDTEILQRFISMGVTNFIVNIVTICGILAVLLSWNYKFGLLFSLIIPFIIFGIYIYAKKIHPAYQRSRTANGKLTSVIQESLAGIKEVKIFGNEKFIKNKFSKYNQNFYKANIDAGKESAFWIPYVNVLIGVCTGVILLTGGWLIIKGEFTIGMLMGAIGYITMLQRPIRMITRLTYLVARADTAAVRIFELLDTQSEIKDSPDAVKLTNTQGKVEYKNVCFSYTDENYIINDVSLCVQPGQTAAFVGPSGVGKTTALHLLPRFYDLNSGQILIDGIDIKNIVVKNLRKNVGIVMQNTFLFDGTIADNISYGKMNAPLKNIKRAAETAQISDFIETLPLGYNTPIGERGIRLSGGQAQRLSLARVLVTDPKILILDEPTAQVDAITDQKLINAVREVMKSRTTFVIAHRLWTIKNADIIFVMKEGKIIASGKHDDLVKNNAFYREFFASQFSED